MIPKAEGGDKYDDLSDRPISEKRPVSRIGPANSASSARLENNMGEQIASIPALVERGVKCLFGNAAEPQNQVRTRR